MQERWISNRGVRLQLLEHGTGGVPAMIEVHTFKYGGIPHYSYPLAGARRAVAEWVHLVENRIYPFDGRWSL